MTYNDTSIHNGLCEGSLFLSFEVDHESVVSSGDYDQAVLGSHLLSHIFKVIDRARLSILTNHKQSRGRAIHDHIIGVLQTTHDKLPMKTYEITI